MRISNLIILAAVVSSYCASAHASCGSCSSETRTAQPPQVMERPRDAGYQERHYTTEIERFSDQRGMKEPVEAGSQSFNPVKGFFGIFGKKPDKVKSPAPAKPPAIKAPPEPEEVTEESVRLQTEWAERLEGIAERLRQEADEEARQAEETRVRAENAPERLRQAQRDVERQVPVLEQREREHLDKADEWRGIRTHLEREAAEAQRRGAPEEARDLRRRAEDAAWRESDEREQAARYDDDAKIYRDNLEQAARDVENADRDVSRAEMDAEDAENEWFRANERATEARQAAENASRQLENQRASP